VRQAEQRVSRRIEAALTPHQLTIDQWRVLDQLSDGEGHPMSGIATQVVVPGPTLTKIVDRLIESALVYRRVDDADRRRVLVFLSERGHSLHDQIIPVVTQIEREILDELGTTDALRLEELLNRMIAGSSSALRPQR
jgi:DNA-binding MarR family transcriptional regulator